MVVRLREPGSRLSFKYLHVYRASNNALSYYLKGNGSTNYSLNNLQLKKPLPAFDKPHINLLDRINSAIITGVYNYYDHEVPPERWQPPSHWDDHPDYPASDWMREVGEGDTRLGYVDWVNTEMEVRQNG
jgi:hypothetical protein